MARALAHVSGDRVPVTKEASPPKPVAGLLAKDLVDGRPEAGIHAHILDRNVGATDISGAHQHMFLTPTGDILITELDGAHQHDVHRDSDYIWGGSHAHKLRSDSTDLITQVDGYHEHALQSGTTVFDGLHDHALVIEGATLVSLMPHQIAALRGFRNSGPLVVQDPEADIAVTMSKSGNLQMTIGDLRLEIVLSRGREVSADDFTIYGSSDLLPLEGAVASFVEEWDPGIPICKGTLEAGLLAPDQQEYFLRLPPPLGGTMTLKRSSEGNGGPWSVRHGIGVPAHLLAGAPVPVKGMSGLPKSLREDVPKSVRYWELDTPSDIARARDWLVETGFFTKAAEVRLLDGEIRKVCVQRTYFEHVIPHDFESSLEDVVGDRASDPVVVSAGKNAALDKLVQKYADDPRDLIFSVLDTSAARHELSKTGRLFKLNDPAEHGRLFATNFPTDNTDRVTWVSAPEPTSEDMSAGRVIDRLNKTRILRADTAEERFVYGIAMEPDVTDSHGHFQTKATIRAAAHGFMQDFGNVGLEHQKYINAKVKILESALAMSDFQIGEEKVTEGSWVFAVRILDDEIWRQVQAGELTGFSIGGMAVLEPTR